MGKLNKILNDKKRLTKLAYFAEVSSRLTSTQQLTEGNVVKVFIITAVMFWEMRKFSCKVNSEIIAMIFKCHCIKSHWFIWHFEKSPTHAWYVCMDVERDALIIWKILVGWIKHIFHMLTHFIIEHQKITFIYLTTSLIKKDLKSVS